MTLKLMFGRRSFAGGLMAAALLLLPLTVQAQQAAQVIGVLDVDMVLQETQAAKSVRSQAEKYQQTFVQENNKEEAALRATQQELANEQQKKVLTQEAFGERVRAFEEQVGQFKNKSFAREKAFQKSYSTAMAQIQKAMLEATQEVAQTRGFTMVLPRTQVILFDEKMNVTKEVVAAMDKKLTRVDFPAPKVELEMTPSAGSDNATTKKKSQ
ncbi:MAG TPA: OmpH family outer membrane protein [Rhodospirillaceae bacterium]|nr:OmpH family outer membrane protein [Rhodospirillaceae bacterium]